MKIGDVDFSTINVVTLKNNKTKKEVVVDCDCDNCIMCWTSTDYESGYVDDSGCYFNRDFDVPIWKCFLPEWIKKRILKRIENNKHIINPKKSCEKCFFRDNSLTTKKRWKCRVKPTRNKSGRFRFNIPIMHGWFCPYFTDVEKVKEKEHVCKSDLLKENRDS